MRAFFAFCIICGFLCGFLYIPAVAQWEYGGNLIGYHSRYTDDFALTNIGDSAAVIVWNRYVSGDFDIWAQYVDSAGYSRWGELGSVVFEDDAIEQGYPAVLPDGEGGVFVVWSDWRHLPDEGIALYGQRLDSNFNKLWNERGVRLTYGTGSNIKAALFDDSNGGFVAVYKHNYDVGAQRVNSNGVVLWDSAGIELTTAPGDQLYPKTVRATDTTFITSWKDNRDISTWESDIYMQSFDLGGNILWDPDGVPAVHQPDDQGYLDKGDDIVADGEGGAVVVWVDWRHHGYNKVLYADRISANGQSQWQVNGLKLGDEHFNLATECQVFNVDGNFLFRWFGYNGYFEASYLRSNGIPIWWGVVVLDSNVCYDIMMEPVGIFKYKTYIAPNFVISKMDTSGTQYWNNRPPCWAMGDRIVSHTDGSEGLIFVWGDLVTSEIRISRIYGLGFTGGDSSITAINNQSKIGFIDFKILGVSPNPFNSHTSIDYQLYKKTDLTMEVFDILGRRILEKRLAGQIEGKHSYNINMNDKPSGVYFVRMTTAEGLSGRIRILLLK